MDIFYTNDTREAILPANRTLPGFPPAGKFASLGIDDAQALTFIH